MPGALASVRFRIPPGVALSSAEAFSDVECETGQKVFISTTDVENCFYKLRISKELSAFFALPPVTAGSVGISKLDEEILVSDDLVYPCFSCLPWVCPGVYLLLSTPMQVVLEARRL